MIDLRFWRRFAGLCSMNHGKTVLAQILEGLHPEQFRRCAQRHPMKRETPALSAYDHFAAMVFAQLTYRESLRDIKACLGSRRPAALPLRHSRRSEALISRLRKRDREWQLSGRGHHLDARGARAL